MFGEMLKGDQPFFDIVVLLASDEAQTKGFEAEIAERMAAGQLPRAEYRVFADGDFKIGNGGAMMQVRALVAARCSAVLMVCHSALCLSFTSLFSLASPRSSASPPFRCDRTYRQSKLCIVRSRGCPAPLLPAPQKELAAAAQQRPPSLARAEREAGLARSHIARASAPTTSETEQSEAASAKITR